MLRRYVVVNAAATIGQGSVAIGMVERPLAWLVGCQEL
jgi:hypothetical protein